MNSLIVVNLSAELPDQAAAISFESATGARLAPFGRCKQSETRRSPRWPDLVDVFLIVEPSIEPDLAFDGILASLGNGWERHSVSPGEQSAYWNDRDCAGFFSPDVRVASVDSHAESNLSGIRILCSSLADFSRSFGRVARAMSPERKDRLMEIRKAFLIKYGIEDSYERMKNRTALEIFVEYQPGKIKPIAAGEVRGVRYQLFDPPDSNATDNQ
jgi:hypothetical protein